MDHCFAAVVAVIVVVVVVVVAAVAVDDKLAISINSDQY